MKRVAIILFAVNAFASPLALADRNADVRRSAEALYAALAKQDSATVARYLPAAGFTEFNPEALELQQLNAAMFREALESGVRPQFQLADLKVNLFGSSALITGKRVGTLTLPNSKPVSSVMQLTMVWLEEKSGWKLQHVHLSELAR